MLIDESKCEGQARSEGRQIHLSRPYSMYSKRKTSMGGPHLQLAGACQGWYGWTSW